MAEKNWSDCDGLLHLTSTLRWFAETGSVTHAGGMSHDAALLLKNCLIKYEWKIVIES